MVSILLLESTSYIAERQSESGTYHGTDLDYPVSRCHLSPRCVAARCAGDRQTHPTPSQQITRKRKSRGSPSPRGNHHPRTPRTRAKRSITIRKLRGCPVKSQIPRPPRSKLNAPNDAPKLHEDTAGMRPMVRSMQALPPLPRNSSVLPHANVVFGTAAVARQSATASGPGVTAARGETPRASGPTPIFPTGLGRRHRTPPLRRCR